MKLLYESDDPAQNFYYRCWDQETPGPVRYLALRCADADIDLFGGVTVLVGSIDGGWCTPGAPGGYIGRYRTTHRHPTIIEALAVFERLAAHPELLPTLLVL